MVQQGGKIVIVWNKNPTIMTPSLYYIWATKLITQVIVYACYLVNNDVMAKTYKAL
jgi:hypothetical protein